ncbi:hypothetical protein Bca101_042763 [Brassica carinata]
MDGRNKEAKERSNREKLRCVSFPPGADAILQDLFTHNSLCDGDTAATSFNKYVRRSANHLKEMECAKGLSMLSHYHPPCPEPDLASGTSPHSARSFLTILLQDHCNDPFSGPKKA